MAGAQEREKDGDRPLPAPDPPPGAPGAPQGEGGQAEGGKPLGGEERARLCVRVSGRVQGVMFRDFARKHARRLGLSGYARNLPDGSTVEVVAEGPRPALLRLRDLLGQGPPLARVDRLEEEWGPFTGTYQGFSIY